MPLYLCQSGSGKPQPWRHGVSVYATPCRHGEEEDFPSRPLRRLRHGEIILVDDVCVALDQLWLRLRWPGSKGGFAGYLPLDKPCDESKESQDKDGTNDGEFFFMFGCGAGDNIFIPFSFFSHIYF